MQTITIDIINNKAVRLLEELELLKLIRVHREKPQSATANGWGSKYKGAMTKQPLAEIDSH